VGVGDDRTKGLEVVKVNLVKGKMGVDVKRVAADDLLDVTVLKDVIRLVVDFKVLPALGDMVKWVVE
jgi:hypothetical protein